jgi:uncharacterized protein with ParB-like and HNH nuclease domain
MENKVYYGEYSLKHWIELILKGNIILPWYQRSFVWDKKRIEELIRTIENNQFVPPVIIGAVKEKGEWKNYILDGQQRLTSILFAKCNKYLDKEVFVFQKPDSEIESITDDVTSNEEENIDKEIKMVKWNFNEVIKDKKIYSEELEKTFYKELFNNSKDEKFFNEHYLGFAYIKPGNNVKDEEQSKFYSDIFRNINTGGITLTRLESRKSLYFLKENLKDFFAPEFLDNIKVKTSSKESSLIDFIKYLSILAQYKKNRVLLKYGGRNWEKNEDYYKKYITAVIDNDASNELHFDVSYPIANSYTNDRLNKLKDYISKLDISKEFDSIIDMDMFFFGLVNEIVFENKKIDITQKKELFDELRKKIKEFKSEERHKEDSYRLKYLKPRIENSIEIYKKYAK